MSSPQSPATRVPIWDLLPNEHTEKEAPENTEALLSLRAGEESVIGTDERVLVPSREFGPGGKYRSVVKLFLRFEAQEIDDPWALASGWLIRNDLVVTAGHCAFDHSHGLGRLTHVKAYIGYHGNESINDPSYAVQFRTAKQVVTTQNWLEDGSNEAFDVSFILLESPFDDITPIQYEATPQTGNSKLGIVGYPGDLMDKDTGEKGAFMWEMFQETSWNLATSSSHMLQYKIDTYGGNSGSAVFIQPPIAASDAISIGVHVYGGNPNSASVIGHLGNDFAIYLAALNAYTSGTLPTGATRETVANQPWLTYITIPTRDHDGSWDPSEPSNGGDGTETEIGDGPGTLGGKITGVDEGLLDILNKAVKVVSPIAATALQIGLPLALGPVGAPVSALAGVALNVAGKIAASATGTEADTEKSYTFNGVAERAILGEGAIACLKHMGNAKCKSLGIFDSMSHTVKSTAPTLAGVAPEITPAVAEAALRMTLDSLSRAQDGTEGSFITPPIRDPKRKETDTTGLAPRLSENQEAFIAALGASLTREDTESFLGVLSSVGNVISQGLRVAAPIIGSVAQTGLSLLLQGTEADENTGPFSFEGLAERSLIGEAALMAIMNMPVGTVQEEGLFDIMKKVVTTIGPAVLKTAPIVISAVTPIVQGLLQGKSKGNEEVIINPNGDILIDAAEIGVWPAGPLSHAAE
ncbi:hypothetical protein O1611_g9378 [Lasiodiplodia mahajangana]|uniref:Uncharacterized protein n=1 Tax=Lasiodiplodia mahajangana TaxID=1108764 RepID=A0ACC2J9S7_9PEZI|nr:hypothetical protein O1611_g9378 [Lasiodiplodia mahajangana]